MAILGNTLIARIQNRRGRRINLPQPLNPGELGWCQDTKQLYIGVSSDNAIPAIELYSEVGAEAIAEAILNDQIIQFDTPMIRLNADEVSVMDSIGSLPVSSYIYGRNRKAITDYEDLVEILVIIKNIVLSAIQTVGEYPYALLYDWAITNDTTATATGTQLAGAVNSITIVTGGSGYDYLPTLTIGGDGSGARAIAVVTDGVVTGYTGLVGGSLYTTVTVTVSAPIVPQIGGIKTVAVIGAGSSYVIGDVISASSGSGTGAQLIVTGVGGGGTVTSLGVYNGGTNYQTSDNLVTTSGGTGSGCTFDVLTIYSEDKSDELFEFTFHLGISDASSGIISNSELAEVITTIDGTGVVENVGVFGINPFTEVTAVSIATAGSGYTVNDVLTASGGTGTGLVLTVTTVGGGNSITGVSITNPGVGYLDTDVGLTVSGGTGTLATFDVTSVAELFPHGNQFLSGSMILPTPRQSANVSGLINWSSMNSGTSSVGLTNTKQNVEILTELNTIETSEIIADYLITNSITYRLIPTAVHPTVGAFTQVVDDDAITADLEYTVADSDVQLIEYSAALDGNDYTRSGVLRIVTAADGTVTVDDDFTESRGAGLTPVTADLDFDASYAAGVVTVEYRHNFVEDIIFKFTTRRWSSF